MKPKINFEVLKGAKDFFVIAQYAVDNAIVCVLTNKADANKTVNLAQKILKLVSNNSDVKFWISASLQTVLLTYGDDKTFFGDTYSDLENVRRAYNFFFNLTDLFKSLMEDTANVAFGG